MQWVEIKDRLPDKGDFVLVWDGDGVCMAEYNGNYFGLSVNGQDYMISATHWMPLPEAPVAPNTDFNLTTDKPLQVKS